MIAGTSQYLTMPDSIAGRQTMGFGRSRVSSAPAGHGITADLIGQPITPLLNGAAAMRLDWIRQPVNWADIEPEPGVFLWESLDTMVPEVRTLGFHLLLAIHGAPSWALFEPPAGETSRLSVDPTSLKLFLGTLSARYAGLIDGYQILESPNLAVYWGGTPSPEAYVQLLHVAHEAIKKSDPGALVVSADLFLGDPGPQPSSVRGLVFLQEMLQISLVDNCDILAVSLDPSVPSPVDQLASVRQSISPQGEVPIWITGAGWSCADIDSARVGACEGQQAAYLINLAHQISNIPWIQMFMVDNLNLAAVDPTHPASGKSLIRSDWSPRPVFIEFARMRQEQAVLAEWETAELSYSQAYQSGSQPYPEWPNHDTQEQ
jgi:hypothetical protein